MIRPSTTFILAVSLLGVGCTSPAGTDPGVTPLDPDVPPVTTGRWVRPDAATTWQWQLSGLLNLEFESALYVVDLFDTSFTDVSRLEAQGAAAFCWASVGVVRAGRNDASAVPEEALGEAIAEGHWVDIRHPDVHAWARARLDWAVRQGCEGVALDHIDPDGASTGFTVTAAEQFAYARHLYNEAHERGLAVAFMGAADQVDPLVEYADVAISRRCHEQDACDAFRAFQVADKPLLDAEFAPAAIEDPVAVCVPALIDGVRTLIVDPALDNSVRISCDEDLPSDTALADVETFATYRGRAGDALRTLRGLDLTIVVPEIALDERRALQISGRVAAHVPVGVVYADDTYRQAGVPVLGQALHDAHPDWFIEEVPGIDAWFADPEALGWQDFVLDQAFDSRQLGYDGLFLEGIDAVEANPASEAGMVALIERVEQAFPEAVLILGGGVPILDRAGHAVDAVMMEGLSSRFDAATEQYVEVDPSGSSGRERLEQALTYRLQGGVVLAQDFGEPRQRDEAVVCGAQRRARQLRFTPSYTDWRFDGGFAPYPEACPWPGEPRLGLAFEPGVAHLAPGTQQIVEVMHAGTGGFESGINLSVSMFPPSVDAGFLSSSQVPLGGVVELRLSGRPSLGVGEWPLPVAGAVLQQSRVFELPVVGHHQSLWVAQDGASAMVVLDDPIQSAVPWAVSRHTERAVERPYGVAIDATGASWVVDNVGDPGAKQPAGRVLVYAPFALSAPRTVVNEGLSYPRGIAIDAAGVAWVASTALDNTGTPRGTPSVATIIEKQAFATPAFRFNEKVYGYPHDLAFAPDGQLFVTTTTGLVLGFTVPAPALATPGVVITGSKDAFDIVRGITFDDEGDLWLTGEWGGEGRVLEIESEWWTTDAQIDVVDLQALLTTDVFEPQGLDVDDVGRLWVVNRTDGAGGPGHVLRFDAPATGAVPDQRIPLAAPALGVAVGAR